MVRSSTVVPAKPTMKAPSTIPSADELPPAKSAEELSSRRTQLEYSARQVAEEGVRFVPHTLRYLGVPAGVLMDAAQDVLLVALRRLGEFEGRSSLRTWLYGICVNVAYAYRRRARKSNIESLVEAIPEAASVASQECDVGRVESRRVLNALLDQLDEAQRAVFVLYELEQLSMREVADALNCPLQTAYSRHKSAKKRVLAASRRLGSLEAG